VIIQSRHLSIFGHIACVGDDADAYVWRYAVLVVHARKEEDTHYTLSGHCSCHLTLLTDVSTVHYSWLWGSVWLAAERSTAIQHELYMALPSWERLTYLAAVISPQCREAEAPQPWRPWAHNHLCVCCNSSQSSSSVLQTSLVRCPASNRLQMWTLRFLLRPR